MEIVSFKKNNNKNAFTLKPPSGEIINTPLSLGSGYVYHLLDEEDNVVYVGSTINIYQRYASHLQSDKYFLKIRFWEVSKRDMFNIEAEHIIKLYPKYNSNLPNNDVWFSFEKYKKQDPFLKGKKSKANKIMRQKGWNYEFGCLKLEWWKEISKILEERGQI